MDDDIVELVPYYKFNNIKDLSEGNSCTVYLVTSTDGNYIVRYLSRHTKMKFGLKRCLNYVTRDNEFLIFLIESINANKDLLKIYGTFDNLEMNKYAIVIRDGFCEECEKCGEGGFATVFSTEWEDGPLNYNIFKSEYERLPKRKFALKRLEDTKNITNEFLNEVKAYSISTNLLDNNILKIYGMSQDPITKDYIMVLDYADGGSLSDWMKNENNYKDWKTTGRQPFDNSTHYNLALDICNGVRPEISESEAPKLYIDLMKRCWDLNPDNRPNANEIYDLFLSYDVKKLQKFSSIEDCCSSQTYSQSVCISRLVDNSECVDCSI
ncbi:kinase-like domain-containing protein [Rhizophagus clarus]|uniref:Kinase-like domain-containing protein n=1 Tax=Rhizophagus clarus TaxID=94130 RepID=A0A8H3KUL2_9GLOM|nr:kinase-like domain-containing protein [Rhizophagus clarus]